MNLSNTLHPIPGLPDYAACLATGQIVHVPTGQTLRQRSVRSAVRYYWRIRIGCRTYAVSRLLMAAHFGRELTSKEQIRHRNNNTLDNCIANMEIGTALDNAKDKIGHDTNGRILRNAGVWEIRHLFPRIGAAALARRYGVSAKHIRRIVAGQRWAGLPT